MARLAGKIAYITGAGSGIGRATAELFAREGARVTIAEYDAARGEEVAHRITAAGGQAIAIATDVREPESVEASIRQAVRHWGGLHVLHNNAGGSTPLDGSVVDAPLEEFWRAITLDLYGTFLGCRFGIPEIVTSGGGSVINMSSVVALMGFEGRDCYTAAKGGIAALTRSLAVEFGRKGVRVNALAPSVTMTERVQRLLAGNAGIQKVADTHLLGLGEPMDMAQAALYLASDEARIVTGTILPVDSGTLAA
ncbi:SDR family oxidoreductase [Siccirubricoccus sp. KC 17139]|uniref:SDR family oxidoreductase n=1 Tax=Siccirubricoccus soli TaxID=2899147 RepID=A0ABT1D8T0_9PROT|nr:SDR family oxidoreductase [Siccirubricoccus soli]MCO6418329.1 SDR family oxidoreductase [Siccirubricoccus soli]MCP2684464.1 SDR family oxidoreductase [Siccirubricoccus soli]